MILLGAFNVLIWAETTTTLTTTAGSPPPPPFSVADQPRGGQGINGANVPPGTTIGALAGTDVTLAFAPGTSAPMSRPECDADALFGDAVWVGTIQFERSFDGGQTYLICGLGGAGQGAIYGRQLRRPAALDRRGRAREGRALPPQLHGARRRVSQVPHLHDGRRGDRLGHPAVLRRAR
jgi:hypothetical protein